MRALYQACLLAGLVWIAPLAAQDHAPASKDAAHAPPPKKAAAPDAGSPRHVQKDSGHASARPPGSTSKPAPRTAPAKGAADSSRDAQGTPSTGTARAVGTGDAAGHGPAPKEANAAKATPDADDHVERDAPPRRSTAPRSAGSRELDAVMHRINRRISALAPEDGPKPAVVPAVDSSRPPAPPSRGPAPSSSRGAAAPVLSPARVRLSWRPTVVWPPALLQSLDEDHVELAWQLKVD